MRLGADPVKLHEGTRAREIFGEAVIYKRHRHRYEVNNMLRRRLEDEGLVGGGTSPDERLVEIIELPDHPFFVASQFHPEFNSRPTRPEPLFREFVGAAAQPGWANGRRRRRDRRCRGDRLAAEPAVRGRRPRRPPAARRSPCSLLPMEGRLHQRFVRYCEVRSPTGEEREVADTLAGGARAGWAWRWPRTRGRGGRRPAPAT